jgi:hypothetical protein
MPYGNISATLSDADLQATRASLDAIRAKLPFLVSLTPKERQKLVKMGEKSVAFVQQCLQTVKDNPDLMPPTFNLQEFERDVDLASKLLSTLLIMQDLCAKLDDTLLAVGSEAMQQSLDVYAQVKLTAKRDARMKASFEQLATRYKGLGQRRKPTEKP